MRAATAGWHRHPILLKNYGILPHRWLNRALARFTAARRPRWAVQQAITSWSRWERIELEDFEERRFESLDDFFLRRLRPGARPIEDGFVSPADGKLVDAGTLERGRTLRVKGEALSLERIVNAGLHDLELSEYDGGTYAVVFLTPRGYHRIHMPFDGMLRDVRWIPGRFFPQNEVALRYIPRVYERNERAVLRCALPGGGEYLLVLVGASLIGGIHLEAMPRAAWVGEGATRLERNYEKGAEIAHFAFGSTVVILMPQHSASVVAAGPEVRMGETLLRLR